MKQKSIMNMRFDLKPGMGVGVTKYITDQRVVNPSLPMEAQRLRNWYLFRVPVKDFTNKWARYQTLNPSGLCVCTLQVLKILL
jgi:hypothetical protein